MGLPLFCEFQIEINTVIIFKNHLVVGVIFKKRKPIFNCQRTGEDVSETAFSPTPPSTPRLDRTIGIAAATSAGEGFFPDYEPFGFVHLISDL
jgi:hypothetical protein